LHNFYRIYFVSLRFILCHFGAGLITHSYVRFPSAFSS